MATTAEQYDIESPRAITFEKTPTSATFLVNEKLPRSSSPSNEADSATSPGLPYSDVPPRPVPSRKYTKKWFIKSWDGAVARGHLPRVVYGGVGLLVVVIWIGLTLQFAKEQVDWNDEQANKFSQHHDRPGAFVEYGLGLSGSLKHFDDSSRKLTVEWSGVLKKDGSDDLEDLAPELTGTYSPVNIYRDSCTMLYFKNSGNATTHPDWWYRIDNSTVAPAATLGMHVWDSFETDISFAQQGAHTDIYSQPLFSYPWDKWKGGVTFVANDITNGMNTTLADGTVIKAGQIIPLVGARLIDSSLNWRFDLNYEPDTCLTSDTAVEASFAAKGVSKDQLWAMSQKELEKYPVSCHLMIEITATRPPLVKFAAIMSVIVNWTSTFFIFILTCETLIMRRGYMMSGTDLLGVTFTSLFALPSIRLLLPGAPDFGALNLVGIIPNVIIISLCIVAIAITKLNRDKKHGEQKED